MLGLTKKNTGVELRNSKRFDFQYMAHITSGDKHAITSMQNLSIEGAKLKNSLNLSHNDEITIRPILPNHDQCFELHGVVVRTDEYDQSIGIKSTPRDMSNLLSLIKTIMSLKQHTAI